MSKRTGLWTAVFFVVLCSNAIAFWSGASGFAHERMAECILDYHTIAPYVDLFTKYGLSTSSVIDTANSEPDPHNGWAYIVTPASLHNTALTNYNVGMLLHAAADGGVAVQHNPAVWDNYYAHDLFEARAEEVDFPSFEDTDLVSGTFYNIKTTLYNDQIALSEDYQDWYNDQLIPLYAPAAMVKTGMRNGLRMSEAILKEFFEYYGFFEPSTTIAYYRFDEGMDQYIYNYSGSADKKLRLGSSTGVDDCDPTWTAGLYVGAIQCQKASDNNDIPVYARCQSWTTANAVEMAPVGSYTLEIIFKADNYADYSAWDNNNPRGLIKYYDGADGGKVQYQLTLKTEAVDGALHKAIRYYSDHADGTCTDVVFDPQASGFEMITGRWYYVGVVYNNNVGQLEIIIRDLVNDGMLSQTYSSKPVAGMTASPGPVFLIGTQRLGSRSFDGKIDEVRISNTALADTDRLYGGSTIAHWEFNEGTGQTVTNSWDSNLNQLKLGSSTSADSSDPTWDTGLHDAAIHCHKPSDNGDIAVYARNNTWTAEEAGLLAPSRSYTLEAVICPDSFAAYTTYDLDNPRGIINYFDGTTGKVQYQLRLQTISADSVLHKAIWFYSDHADGTSTDVVFDAQAAGLEMVAGRWYYVAAIYNDCLGTVEIVLRDLQTGSTVSQSYACSPVAGVSASPSPVFLIGTQSIYRRSFDGIIDDIRISNAALAEKDRLYSREVMAYWKFDDRLSGAATTAGQRILDSSGNGRDLYAGTGSSLPTFGDSNPEYGSGASIVLSSGSDELIFDSGHAFSDGGVNAGPVMGFAAVDSFTIEAMVKIPSTTSSTAICCIAQQYPGSTTSSIYLRFESSTAIRFAIMDTDGISKTYTKTGLSNCYDGNWHHVAGVRDTTSDALIIYLDYVEIGRVTDTTTGSFIDPDGIWHIGAMGASSTREFIGSIDFIRVSRGALTPAGMM